MDWIKQNRVSLASMTGIVVAVGAVWIVSGTPNGTDTTPPRPLVTTRKIRDVPPVPTVRRDQRPESRKPPTYVRNIRNGDGQRDPVGRKRGPRGGEKKQRTRKLVPGC